METILELENKIEEYKSDIKLKESSIKINNNAIKILKNKCEDLKIEIYNLKKENKELKEELQKLKVNSVQKIKNERGAGRKSKITDDIIAIVTMLRLQGKSIRAIAKEVELSVGTVQKIISEYTT